MKKKLILILMLIPFIVYADDTCDESKQININSGDKVTCDKEKVVTARFEGNPDDTYTIDNGLTEGAKNSVCTIKCYENLTVSFNPIVKVLAGMGFRYPLYVSGERICTATYNYSYYENKMRELLNDPVTNKNALANLYGEKEACDNFAISEAEKTKDDSIIERANENKYAIAANKITLTLTPPVAGEIVEYTYEWEDIGDDNYTSVVNIEQEVMPSCGVYDKTNKECRGDFFTISSWTETSKIFGKFTMSEKAYVEKYTGNVYNSIDGKDSNKFCPGKDKYYTSLESVTNYGVDQLGNDKGYDIKLSVEGLGNKKINFDVNCLYQVDNLIYPTNPNDPNHSKYGDTAFQYRIVDVDDPFPNRDAYANWYGHEKIITDLSGNLGFLERWRLNLTKSSIQMVADDDSIIKRNYTTFDLDESEHSNFIKDLNSKIKNTVEDKRGE